MNILEQYRDEVNQNLNLTMETDKKRIIIEDKAQALKLKLKIYNADNQEDEEPKMAMRFIKVQGDLMEQQKLMSELITYLEEIIIDEDEQ